MAEDPNIEEMLDKAMLNRPRTPDADKPEAEATPEAPADTVEAPAPEAVEEPVVDASVILMREDYSRKMHEVGQARRELEAEKARLAELRELADRLDTDEQFRTQFESAWQASQNGQAPSAPSPGSPAYDQRIRRLEATLMQQQQQAHLSLLDAESQRMAQEYGLAEKDKQAVVMEAVRAGLLDYGTPPELVRKRLNMAAAAHVLPNAKATGQRQLLDQLKDRNRQATPVAEKPVPPEAEPDVTKMSEREYEKYLIGIAEKAGRGAS